MANAGKIVIVAALDGTFQRLGFGDILRLIPLAESVVKLKAVCMACFNDASFTKRTTLDQEVSAFTIVSLINSLFLFCLVIFYAFVKAPKNVGVFQLELIGGEDKYMAVCRSCHQSPTTVTPSKFPLSEITNSSKSPFLSKNVDNVKAKRDLSNALKGDSMDVEN